MSSERQVEAILGLVAYFLGLGLRSAVVVGLVLALSSTVFALQLLEERQWSEIVTGKTAFSVLLFQDLRGKLFSLAAAARSDFERLMQAEEPSSRAIATQAGP
jgi:predicted Kef-type K+ transport protein